ncbi:MAG: radical SAM protein, partial [Treponema sp.]|nr:radical SAM protein [Treponema sp.]
MPICDVCFRHCNIEEGQTGFCGGRICRKNQIVAENYGRLTSVALDPIEKKPLKMFYPGSMILSLGSYGCNLRCPFCQNSSISWSKEA